MKKERILSVLLVFVLLLSFAGCGSTETTSDEPTKETTTQETAAQETAVPDFQEKVFVDDENCTFKITEIDPDNEWGYTLKVYIENKTDKNLMFAWNDVSVNGYMCDPFWAATVQGGKKSIEEISFSTSDFEELGIEDVENIEFKLSVYDDDDFEAPYLVDEMFALTVNE